MGHREQTASGEALTREALITALSTSCTEVPPFNGCESNAELIALAEEYGDDNARNCACALAAAVARNAQAVRQ